MVPVTLLPKIGSTIRRRMHGGAHVAVAARAGEVEEAHAFHEERPLLRKETGNRWLTCTWKASLSTWLKSGLIVPSSVIPEVIPTLPLMPAFHLSSAQFQRVGGVAILVDAVGHARQRLDQAARLEVVEDQMRRPIEHPLAGQHLRPRIGVADAADLAEEHQPHAHIVASAKRSDCSGICTSST